MKNRPLSYLLFFLLLVLVHSAQAASPVWKIVKGDSQLFIGGTIHVLSDSDYPLPQPFETAYKKSVKLVFETDLQKMQSPEFQKIMLSQLVYSDGRNLKTVLNQKIFQKLEKHFSQRGIPMENIIGLKPGMVTIMMLIVEFERLGILGTGVDEFFILRAVNDNKSLGQLEGADEQVAFISNMGKGQENELIEYSLNDIKALPEMMQTMKAAWRAGDNKTIKKLSLDPIRNKFPQLYDDMVVKRNNAWLPKIEAMLITEDVEFILVGALHLVGEDGLLSLLAEKGYTVQAF